MVDFYCLWWENVCLYLLQPLHHCLSCTVHTVFSPLLRWIDDNQLHCACWASEGFKLSYLYWFGFSLVLSLSVYSRPCAWSLKSQFFIEAVVSVMKYVSAVLSVNRVSISHPLTLLSKVFWVDSVCPSVLSAIITWFCSGFHFTACSTYLFILYKPFGSFSFLSFVSLRYSFQCWLLIDCWTWDLFVYYRFACCADHVYWLSGWIFGI